MEEEGERDGGRDDSKQWDWMEGDGWINIETEEKNDKVEETE